MKALRGPVPIRAVNLFHWLHDSTLDRYDSIPFFTKLW